MRTFIAIIIFCVFFTIVPDLRAEEHRSYYFSAKTGISLMEFANASYYSAIGGDQTARYDRASDDGVFGAGVGLGYYLTKNLRAEIEYFYRDTFEYNKRPTNDGIANANQELKTQTLMAQVFYDIPNRTPLTPSVFAGAGIAYHETDADAQLLIAPFFTYQGSNSETEFAWNIGLGAGYALTDRMAIDLMYRYISLGEVEWKNNRTDGGDMGGAEADITANEILVSIRYSF
ncbi:MAG: porin family protein [Deltaproteobacteria bacterium]|nr:porin family protein [Deltaproteobacteria bacterium]